jgi:hypothetical protein
MPSRRVRPKIPETSENQKRAAQAWNAGKVGTGRPASDLPIVDVCTADGCGVPVIGRRAPAAGMVQVRGAADGAAAHWYCPERCAAIARARADIRGITMRPDGER